MSCFLSPPPSSSSKQQFDFRERTHNQTEKFFWWRCVAAVEWVHQFSSSGQSIARLLLVWAISSYFNMLLVVHTDSFSCTADREGGDDSSLA